MDDLKKQALEYIKLLDMAKGEGWSDDSNEIADAMVNFAEDMLPKKEKFTTKLQASIMPLMKWDAVNKVWINE